MSPNRKLIERARKFSDHEWQYLGIGDACELIDELTDALEKERSVVLNQVKAMVMVLFAEPSV